MRKLIASFDKNVNEVVKVELTEYGGNDLVAIRCWIKNPGGEDFPTKKGITLRVENFPLLKKAVDKLGEELIKSGLLSDKKID